MAYESVNKLLADLHAHRVATMKPEDLAVNINQRQYLVDHAERSCFIRAGDVVENFLLPDVVFFRFAGCPACNLTLPNYQRELFPKLAAFGASLLAVSPQVPERLREIKDRHALTFFVASDTDNGLARKFGIAFTSNAASQEYAKARGLNMPQVIGTGTWELPMPAAIVIGTDHVVRFAKVSPDWLVRAEAEEILQAVEDLVGVAKAA
jgi:peroxiredoxin